MRHMQTEPRVVVRDTTLIVAIGEDAKSAVFSILVPNRARALTDSHEH